MENVMKAAHQLAKEIKSEYPNVDYPAQLGICIAYLNKEGANEMNKTYEFKTSKGAEIKIIVYVENNTFKTTVELNGKNYGSATVMPNATLRFTVGKQIVATQIPNNIYKELNKIKEETGKKASDEFNKKFATQIETEENYKKNYNKVMRVMSR